MRPNAEIQDLGHRIAHYPGGRFRPSRRIAGASVKTGLRFKALVAAVLTVVLVGGCGTSLKYSYEPLFSFAELKTYRWTEARRQYWGDSLLESNVRFQVDRVLQTKGFASSTDKPDFIVSIRYEGSDVYELRALTLSVSRADNSPAIWRGC